MTSAILTSYSSASTDWTTPRASTSGWKRSARFSKSGILGDRDAVFVQIAVPSREDVEDYRETRQRIEQLVGQLNGTYGKIGHPVVHYAHRDLPFDVLVAMYQVGDVMVVTPFSDGMNLVAKEFIVSRTNDDGVLVLSEFAGAASELDDCSFCQSL